MGVALALLSIRPARAEAPPPEAAKVLADASEHFRVGAAALEGDHAKARDELTRAIDGFRRLIDEFGVRNGALSYNIGNAHLLLGEVGPAILNYRRAARLIPNDANLAANLAAARQRVPNRIDAPAGERVRRALLFWHDETSAAGRFTLLLWAYAAAWGLALLRVTGVLRLGGWWFVGGAAAVTGALVVSLCAEYRIDAASADAVLTAPQSIGRKGPDASAYEPSFTEPLHGGVEVSIVEQRPGWTLVRMADARETWLPAADVEPIRERPATPRP